jgi:predicted lipid-binding transport protein (Tim44 family)
MRVQLGLGLVAFSLLGCGPDADLVASGKAHSCRLQNATRELADKPGDAALAADVKEATELLQTVIDSADEGERAALGKAIAAAVADGC